MTLGSVEVSGEGPGRMCGGAGHVDRWVGSR